MGDGGCVWNSICYNSDKVRQNTKQVPPNNLTLSPEEGMFSLCVLTAWGLNFLLQEHQVVISFLPATYAKASMAGDEQLPKLEEKLNSQTTCTKQS